MSFLDTKGHKINMPEFDIVVFYNNSKIQRAERRAAQRAIFVWGIRRPSVSDNSASERLCSLRESGSAVELEAENAN